jgi:hypothetical protein
LPPKATNNKKKKKQNIPQKPEDNAPPQQTISTFNSNRLQIANRQIQAQTLLLCAKAQHVCGHAYMELVVGCSFVIAQSS